MTFNKDGPMNENFTKGHFLHVDVVVPKANAAPFERAMKAFLNRGRRRGHPVRPFLGYGDQFTLELKLALKSAKPFVLDGHSTSSKSYKRSVPSGHSVYRYVHLWSIPSLEASDLATMMMHSADDDAYLAIDSQVARETQEFVYEVQWTSKVARVPPKHPKSKSSPQFVRITRQMPSSDVGTYLFDLGVTYPAMSQRDCNALGTFQNVTGLLNTVIEFWQTTGGTVGLKAIDSAFKDLPRELKTEMLARPNKVFPESEVREAFTLAAYSPG
jgi:hypothetical protein